MSNIFDMEDLCMGSMAYQEKSLYGTLAADLVVYGTYFAFLPHRDLNSLVGVMVIVIVAQIVLQSVIAALTRNRRTDERDTLIALKGYRAGYVTMVSLVVVGLGMLWLHTTMGQLDPRRLAIHFLNVLFLFAVLGDVVKTVTQLVMYRRTV
jgi:hypothetical protein